LGEGKEILEVKEAKELEQGASPRERVEDLREREKRKFPALKRNSSTHVIPLD